MRAAVVMSPGMAHHKRWCGAMAAGLERHGIDVELRTSAPGSGGDFAVCWGWRAGAELRRAGLPVLVMEAGHLPNRLEWASCGWNGLGRHGTYPRAQDRGERWERHWGHCVKPWRVSGGYTLVLGQCVGDAALAGLRLPYNLWLEALVEELVALGHRVMFRPHPLARGSFCPGKAERAGVHSLVSDLSGAGMAVTHNSTAAVEAVLYGVPTVTLDEGAMAWPVSTHDVAFPVEYPDRAAWCTDLAWSQFTENEVESGAAWDNIWHAMPTSNGTELRSMNYG